MRIFYAAPTTAHDRCLPESLLWHANLYLPLQDLGHELVTFDVDYGPLNRNLDHELPEQKAFIDEHRPAFGEELLRQVQAALRDGPIDLFFSYFYSAYVEPGAIRAIRDLGIPTMNWYCNGSYQFHLVEEIAPAFDWCLVPERFRLADYRRVGATPIYCQEAANPTVYRPFDVPREHDVSFVGQRYGDRGSYLRRLVDEGIDVRVWGPHWDEPAPQTSLARRVIDAARGRRPDTSHVMPPERCGGPLSDDEYVRMFSRSKVSLGFSRLLEDPADGAPPRQVRLRDFEAPMSGAFYLAEAFDELAEFFEPGREIVFFDGPDELVEKARWYLAHDEERERIRLAGLERARREHTWQNRFRTVFADVGLT